MSVTVSLRELLTFGKQLAQDVLDEASSAVKEREAVIGCTLIPEKEAREILCNPDPSTMYRWSQSGYLRRVKIGVRNYYTAESIQRIINQHTINENTQELCQKNSRKKSRKAPASLA